MSVTQSIRAAALPLLGILLTLAASLGLFAFLSIILFVDAGASYQIWLDYGLVLASLVCALVAGLSMIWAWFVGRKRDVVPGPTLYLLGLLLLTLGAQALALGTWWAALLVIAGLTILVVEYRSEWL